MRRIRYPRMALFVFAGWLALAERITPGQVLLGALIAVGSAWMISRLQLPSVSPRRPRVMLRLLYWVTVDIIRSNFAVARIILTRRSAWQHSNFLMIPLDLRNRAGLALLALIVTATPGTIWVSYDGATGRMLLHVLDLIDEEQWTNTIKNRYERLLMEIYE